MTTYAAFREAHPAGVVLQPESERSVAASGYDPSGHDAYKDREAFGPHGMRGEGPTREWNRDGLGPKAVVLGVTPSGCGALGFPRLSLIPFATSAMTEKIMKPTRV